MGGGSLLSAGSLPRRPRSQPSRSPAVQIPGYGSKWLLEGAGQGETFWDPPEPIPRRPAGARCLSGVVAPPSPQRLPCPRARFLPVFSTRARHGEAQGGVCAMGRGLGNGSPALGRDRRGVSARPRTGPKAGPTPLPHTSSPASLPTRPLPNRTKLRSQEPSHAAGETHKRRENGGQGPTEIAEGAGAHGAARGSGGGGKSRARRRPAAGGERRGARKRLVF